MGRPSSWGEIDYAARLAGLSDGNGYDRGADARTLHPVPEAELVETSEGLCIQDKGMHEESADADGLLEGFVRLADAAPERVLAFVRRFGMLQICRHGQPYHHRPRPYPPPANTHSLATVDKLVERGISKPSELIQSGQVVTWCRPLGVEPLWVWRHFASQAKALLGVAAHVHRGKPGRPEDWEVVYRRLDQEAPWWDQSVEVDRSILARVLDEWMQMCGARPVVGWHNGEERPSVEIGARGLFQNIARDLVLTVARLDGLAVCDGCGEPYTRGGKVEKVRKYCAACRDAGVPARIRKRRQRARERGEANG